jgi:predicted N-acetyltransferase YhbS
MFTIYNETPGDLSAIDQLLDQGFGTDRHDLTVYRLRLGMAPPNVSFVARSRFALAASLRFWPVLIGAGTPALLLGPLVVAPEHQGDGLGKRMVEHGLDRARAAGWRLCLVVGGPGYYRPLGFEPATPWGLGLPGPVDPARFQVRAFGDDEVGGLLPVGDRMIQPWRSVRGGGLIPPATSMPLAA